MKLDVKVKDFIYKDLQTVFKTIVVKEELAKYFVSNANKDIIENTEIMWEWKDFNAKCNVSVLKVETNKHIVFNWEGNQIQTKVEMIFQKLEANKTEVIITESSYNNDKEGIQKVMQQTQGWTDFLCSLKAYLYTGINLRNGKMNN